MIATRSRPQSKFQTLLIGTSTDYQVVGTFWSHEDAWLAHDILVSMIVESKLNGNVLMIEQEA